MLSALVAASGIVASAAMSMASGASQQRAADAAVGKAKQATEDAKERGQGMMRAMAPAVADLGDAASQTADDAERVVKTGGEAIAKVTLPLVEKVSEIKSSAQNIEDEIAERSRRLADYQSRLNAFIDEQRNRKPAGVSSGRMMEVQKSIDSIDKMQNMQVDRLMQDLDSLNDRLQSRLNRNDSKNE